MGGKQSTNTPSRVRTFSGSTPGTSSGAEMTVGATAGASARVRARSLGSFATGPSGTLTIPNSNGNTRGAGSPDSDSSTPEEGVPTFAGRVPHSLPLQLFALHHHGNLPFPGE